MGWKDFCSTLKSYLEEVWQSSLFTYDEANHLRLAQVGLKIYFGWVVIGSGLFLVVQFLLALISLIKKKPETADVSSMIALLAVIITVFLTGVGLVTYLNWKKLDEEIREVKGLEKSLERGLSEMKTRVDEHDATLKERILPNEQKQKYNEDVQEGGSLNK